MDRLRQQSFSSSVFSTLHVVASQRQIIHFASGTDIEVDKLIANYVMKADPSNMSHMEVVSRYSWKSHKEANSLKNSSGAAMIFLITPTRAIVLFAWLSWFSEEALNERKAAMG
ncbi:hypothetical protein CFP56_018547 [Quercus suber]|uniref:Uncharacterized protein n=1 Tax=Quercus suber TaxID=58331 RepID=A0AAW0M3M7_QUESU